MAASKQIAVLIVHGGYFLPDSWQPFINSLSLAGFIVRCPRLPTCGDARPPTATFADDVAVVQSAAKGLIAEGHQIIVLAHSYGGMVASEAISGDLYAVHGSNGGVIHLIFLSAWLVTAGNSVGDLVQKYGFQSSVDVGFNEDGTAWAKNAPYCFFNDINESDSKRAEELATHNVTHNWATASGKISRAPWMDLPATYVHCTKDMAIHLQLQQSMVADALVALQTERTRKGSIVTETIEAGHSPFLSKPTAIVKIVEKIAASA